MCDKKNPIYRYYELIEKPLQTLIKRIEESSSILTSDSTKIYYATHLNGYSNSREFVDSVKQSTLLMNAKPVSNEIHACKNNFQEISFENGDYSSEYVNGDRNGTSIANALSMNIDGETLIGSPYSINSAYRYRIESCLANDGRFIASHPSNISERHDDSVFGQEVNKSPHGMDKNSYNAAALQSNGLAHQTTDTIQEQHFNINVENNGHHQYTDSLLSDSNYRLVIEAIVQLENDTEKDQQQMNVQSTDITTTIGSQMSTPAREHLETTAVHETIRTGIESNQMDSSASEQTLNHNRSLCKETLNDPVSCSNFVGNEGDLAKHAGKRH